MTKQALPITGDGTETRDWTFVGDIVNGLLAMGIEEEAIGEAINLGSGKDHREQFCAVSGHWRTAGRGSADPHQRGGTSFQFPDVAAGVYGVLFYRRFVAGLQQERIGEGNPLLSGERSSIWSY